jgi:peroxiredoxin
VAISADTSEESRGLCERAGLTFPILSDDKTETIRHYDLLLTGSGEKGRDISGAAEFLLDPSGTVRWRKMAEGSSEQFLEAAKKLN